MTKYNKHLYRLEDLSDYKIASGYTDVKGWVVKDKEHRVIGKITGLLANVELERVLYLDVLVDQSVIEAGHDPYGKQAHEEVREFINEKGENHIIIPVGLVHIDEEREYVYSPTIDHRTFANTKRLKENEAIQREYELQVLDFYEDPNYVVHKDDTPGEEYLSEPEAEGQVKYRDNDRWRGDAARKEAYLRNRRNRRRRQESEFYEGPEFDDTGFRKRGKNL